MSDTLEAFSYPTTLEELRQLRAQAAELDIETKRLRRLRGREPATSPRLLPRKKVPVVTEIDLQEQPKPLPRRQAIRHSLITPLAGQNYSFAEPIGLGVPSAPAVGMSGGINRSAFATPAAASRRPFYAQGKAAMSVIEFSSRHKEEQAQAGPTAAPSFFSGRSRNFTGVVPTLSSLRRDKEGLSISTVAPIPEGATQEPSSAKENVPVQSPVTVTPPSSTDTVERIGFVSVKGPGFLGRHKKLSRFLGKPQAA
jgi:hypothetical protein